MVVGWGATSCNTFRFLTQQYNNLKFSIFCSFDVFRSPRIPLCQGTPYVFWENSVCFSRPGFNDTQEVRYCFVVVDISQSKSFINITGVHLYKGWLQQGLHLFTVHICLLSKTWTKCHLCSWSVHICFEP